MSSTMNINIDNINMPSPPPYEVLKLQWQIKELRRMLRTAEMNLATLNEPRPDFVEPLSRVSRPSLMRAPANHIMIDGHWVHQDSPLGQSVINPPPAPAPSPEPAPQAPSQPAPPTDTNSVASSSQSSNRKKLFIQWNKVTMTLAPQDTIRTITTDIEEGRLTSGRPTISWKSPKHFPDSQVNRSILDIFRTFQGMLSFETLKEAISAGSDPHNLIEDGDDTALKNQLRELVHQGILRI